jgi:hypothetical protein
VFLFDGLRYSYNRSKKAPALKRLRNNLTMHEMNKIIVDRSRPRLRGTVFGQASIGRIFVKLFERHNTSSIDVRFDDKTSLNFAIEPGFTLEAQHAGWKTGNWRPIKKWSLIRSQSHRA